MIHADPSSWRDRWSFILLCIVAGAYALLRAASVPWVHDESTSIYWFMERREFLPYVALWDAGNHFLSSAIGILGHKIWGLSLLGSRAGSLLAWPIYAWAAYRIGSMLHERSVRWALWTSLLLCPFLFDFFSLFRGYGLGMSFWLIALDGMIRYHHTFKERHLIQLLIALFLADLAVLSLVPLWALVVFTIAGWHGVLWYRNKISAPWRRLMIWSLLGFLPLMLGVLLAWELKRRGLLYHGSTEGFIDVTLASLSRFVLGSDHVLVLALAAGAVILASLIVPFRKLTDKPVTILAGLLWADVVMRLTMALLLQVNYPEDRAALHMVPLAICTIAFAANEWGGRSLLAKRILMLSLVYLPVRTVVTANLDHTLLWPEQSVPTRFLQRIAQHQAQADRPLLIGAYHQLAFSLPYASRINGIPLNPPDVVDLHSGTHDVRIVDDRFLREARIGYKEVDHAPGNGLHLLVREEDISTTPSEWRAIVQPDDGWEFMELWNEAPKLTADELFLEVRCRIAAEVQFLDLMLVTELADGGEKVHYHTIPAAHLRAHWSGEEFHMLVRVPPHAAERRVVYLWNAQKVSLKIMDMQVRLHRLPSIGPSN